jgi:hypothetical protein
MQLTILLYLIQKRGDSVPAGGTDLYRSYMETFLDREARMGQLWSPAPQLSPSSWIEGTAL